jgi:hypothetical protein
MSKGLVQQRDKVLQYIEATLVHGYTKKDAYLAFIDSDCKAPHQAIARLEKNKEYQDILAVITSDENYKFQIRAQRVKGKFLGLVEKNIDTADQVLDDVKNSEDVKSKAVAVRLVNETIQAMSVISGGAPPVGQPGNPKLDKSGVVS